MQKHLAAKLLIVAMLLTPLPTFAQSGGGGGGGGSAGGASIGSAASDPSAGTGSAGGSPNACTTGAGTAGVSGVSRSSERRRAQQFRQRSQRLGQFIREAKRRDPSQSDQMVSTVIETVARKYFRHVVGKTTRVDCVRSIEGREACGSDQLIADSKAGWQCSPGIFLRRRYRVSIPFLQRRGAATRTARTRC
jgi:hypothetical protein